METLATLLLIMFVVYVVGTLVYRAYTAYHAEEQAVAKAVGPARPHVSTGKGKYLAIAEAQTIEDLTAIWDMCVRNGRAEGGQMHTALLRRKAELGYKLSDGEENLILRARAERARGAKLPAIQGRRG